MGASLVGIVKTLLSKRKRNPFVSMTNFKTLQWCICLSLKLNLSSQISSCLGGKNSLKIILYLLHLLSFHSSRIIIIPHCLWPQLWEDERKLEICTGGSMFEKEFLKIPQVAECFQRLPKYFSISDLRELYSMVCGDLNGKEIQQRRNIYIPQGFPDSSAGKESACNGGDLASIPGLGRSAGGGYGNSLQYSCWRIPMDRDAWQATVYGVAKSQTQLRDKAQHTKTSCHISSIYWNSGVYRGKVLGKAF